MNVVVTAERESERDTGWFSVCVDTNISIKISLILLYKDIDGSVGKWCKFVFCMVISF